VALESCLPLSILGLRQFASLKIYCKASVIAFLQLKVEGLSQKNRNKKHCAVNTVTLNCLYGVVTQYVRFLSFCLAFGEILKSTVLSKPKLQLTTNLPSLVCKNVTYLSLLTESNKEADFRKKSPGNYVSGHGPQFDSRVGYLEWEYQL
jgi:hypothetical protein